ncbi:hypothetical protein Aaci_3098 (plasmid) [Alicyclobacillus acidocaldarius subsp. acidocaldarius DSM 446]|uniref:Uncharacterized protein n=1 Tax=Alicyclobacillus acidocaldarius subsp. acidocaldarius (strain ATCC 27009 / DSM 446 / BCRC 14685 / JCM 5260 / KCTC 1825 / NBRC 15652 / NCIMB 11725 / NRRL B-14509 / 104-IA) TaxID=521098 RepID=C8WSV0_ALIAD|nr:hypothetical protein Aaci_0557 [Alicyclobacillus acidocaldarius subsp. acidocaldarius DSM 446]ACV60094.1 hypothetical protein Aaci_3098 [Alicyclobacillus acidocaldarius subsp. acidocaldarius DSM 446]
MREIANKRRPAPLGAGRCVVYSGGLALQRLRRCGRCPATFTKGSRPCAIATAHVRSRSTFATRSVEMDRRGGTRAGEGVAYAPFAKNVRLRFSAILLWTTRPMAGGMLRATTRSAKHARCASRVRSIFVRSTRSCMPNSAAGGREYSNVSKHDDTPASSAKGAGGQGEFGGSSSRPLHHRRQPT